MIDEALSTTNQPTPTYCTLQTDRQTWMQLQQPQQPQQHSALNLLICGQRKCAKNYSK